MKKMISTLLGVLFIAGYAAGDTGSLSISISGLPSDKGSLLIALCNSEEDYDSDGDAFFHKVVPVSGSVMTIFLGEMPPGGYAAKIIHDENGNGEMDTNFIGMPKEAFGFSNNAKGKMGPPSYKDALFYIEGETLISIEMMSL